MAPTPVVGFASHVDRQLLDAARRAGCARAVARSTVLARRSRLERLLADVPGEYEEAEDEGAGDEA